MDIWGGTNELIKKAYCRPNCRVVDLPNQSDLCLVFFSSHNIYYPNTEESFIYSIFMKERYEWMNTACNPLVMNRVGRIIFVRDVYKQFYVTGINSSCDTIKKTIDYLREQTQHYRVITFGSSAGGYMAMTVGMALGAEYIVNNSGDFDISQKLHLESGLVKQAYNNEENKPYLNLKELLNRNNIPIYYFMAGKNEDECIQYEQVKDIACIKCIRFCEKKHATTVFPGNWAALLLNPEIIEQLYLLQHGKMLKKINVLYRTLPFSKASRIFVHEIKEFMKRRLWLFK